VTSVDKDNKALKRTIKTVRYFYFVQHFYSLFASTWALDY
jgi:hypothetical protein